MDLGRWEQDQLGRGVRNPRPGPVTTIVAGYSSVSEVLSPSTQAKMLSETVLRPSASDSSFFSNPKTSKDVGRSSATTASDNAGATGKAIVVTRVVTVRKPAGKSPVTQPPSTPSTPRSRESTPVTIKKRRAEGTRDVSRPLAKKQRVTPPTDDRVAAGSSRSQTPVQTTKTRGSSRASSSGTPEPAASGTISRSRSVTAVPNDAVCARECWITEDGTPGSDLKSCEEAVKGILKQYKTRTFEIIRLWVD